MDIAKQPQRITVIGGGNMGSVLAVRFSQQAEVTVYLGRQRAEDYAPDLELVCEDDGTHILGRIACVTNDLCRAVQDADWIFITLPAFAFPGLAERMIPLLSPGQHLCFVPGSGGAELFFKAAIDKGCTVTGLQRVHAVARLIEPGRSVREQGIRRAIRIASVPAAFNAQAAAELTGLYHLPVELLDTYLDITLINSNPILHTSRLYTVFRDLNPQQGTGYASLPLFYEEWDLASSELLEQMDEELFGIIRAFGRCGVRVDGIVPLLVHYDSKTPQQMTDKLRSIASLKGLKTPSVALPDGTLLPDLESRYFTADFPYGLDILIAFAEVAGADRPGMLRVSDWYHRITGTQRTFLLADFGIGSLSDLVRFYAR